MSQAFAFPPPPPPPPKRDSQASEYGHDHRNPYHGRGRGRGNGNSRGGFSHRGNGARGRGRGRGAGTSASYHHGSPGRSNSNNQPSMKHDTTLRSSASHISVTPKRTHDTAFGNKSMPVARPKAPPAVPSFNVDIENLLSRKPPPQSEQKPMATKKTNALGLTPSNYVSESESEEDDDETRLAQLSVSDGLTFQHNGQTLSLRTAEEIAMWIAERKKKYPTNVKVEAAKKAAAEKKLKWEAQRKEREEASRLKKEERAKQRHENEKQKIKQRLLAQVTAKAKAAMAVKKDDGSQRALSKAEKLQKEVWRATEQLKKAEEALVKAQVGDVARVGNATDMAVQQPNLDEPEKATDNVDRHDEDNHEMSTDASGESESDVMTKAELEDTSTSGSSDDENGSDTDSAPEEESSKRIGPERVPPPQRSGEAANLRVCRNYVKFGRCKYGKRCHYSHEKAKRDIVSKDKNATNPGKRKGLYQIMVEKEVEEQQKQAMRAIVVLGERGLLDIDADGEHQVST